MKSYNVLERGSARLGRVKKVGLPHVSEKGNNSSISLCLTNSTVVEMYVELRRVAAH